MQTYINRYLSTYMSVYDTETRTKKYGTWRSIGSGHKIDSPKTTQTPSHQQCSMMLILTSTIHRNSNWESCKLFGQSFYFELYWNMEDKWDLNIPNLSSKSTTFANPTVLCRHMEIRPQQAFHESKKHKRRAYNNLCKDEKTTIWTTS